MAFLKKVFVFLISVLLPTLIFTQRTPSISFITQGQIKDVGDSVVLECSVQYTNDSAVVWLKTGRDRADSVFLSVGSALITKNSRYSIHYDESSTTYTLQIKDIKETDAGVYECQGILSRTNKIRASVDVNVRYPPIISEKSGYSRVVTEGESVELDCFATGFPTPTIQWRKDNNAILSTGGSTYSGNVLKINSVRKEDRGTYYCFANNGVGKGDKRNVNLEVEFAPVISVPRSRLGQALQYDIDLVCQIEAYPPPAITWFKGDTQLSNNQHYSISHLGTTDEFTDSTIRILIVEKRQYGDYYCKAVNKFGQAVAKVELFETVTPVCPTADSIFESTGNSLIIKDSRFSIRYDPSTSTYSLQREPEPETKAKSFDCQIIISDTKTNNI